MSQIYGIFTMFVFSSPLIATQNNNHIQQKASIQLLQALNQRDLLKKFSYFLYMKKQYTNSCVHDYSPYKFSKRFGFSPTKHRTTVSWLIKNRWCRLHHGNLTFNSLSYIGVLYGILPSSRAKKTTLLPSQWKVKDIHNQMLLFFIKTEINKQHFVAQIKSDLTLPVTLKNHKRAVKLSKKFDIKGEKIDKRTKLSIFSVAKIFNSSIGTASNILKTLQQAGLIIIKRHITVIGPCPRKAFKYMEDIPGCFYFNGLILKREVNEIIPVVPVKLF